MVVALVPLTVSGRTEIQPGDRIDDKLDEQTVETLVRLGQAERKPARRANG